MSKKSLILCIIAVVLVIGIAAGTYFGPQLWATYGPKSFTVTVVHADGTSKDFSYTSTERNVGTVLQAEGLISGYMGDYGLYMETVDGETVADGAYWSFYIGDAYAQTGIDLTPIKDGASYKLVYEVYDGTSTQPQATEGQNAFTVTVVHADGTSKNFSYTSNEEYLGTALQAEGLISGYIGDYGLYMETVDGETVADGAYWSFYIGDAYAQKGIDLTPIEDGAAYKLVYEVYTG